MVQRASNRPGSTSARTVIAAAKWCIIVCAVLVACAHLAYFGGFTIRPGALRQLQQVDAAPQSSSLTRYELSTSSSGSASGSAYTSRSNSEANWATLIAKASLHEEAGLEVVPPAKGQLLCMDADTNCGAMLKDGVCRPPGTRLDLPLWTCKKFCGVCTGLVHAIAQSLDMEIKLTDHAAVWSGSCTDDEEEEQCKEWAAQGLCSSKPRRMLSVCKSTCGFCADVPDGFHSEDDAKALMDRSKAMLCIDSLDICPYVAKMDLCYSEDHWWAPMACPASCRTCDVPGASPPVHQLSTLRPLQECEDYSSQCGAWKAQTQCLNNPNHMAVVCARTCDLCQYHVKPKHRRAMNPDAKPKGPIILGLDETSALRTAMYVTGESTVCVDHRPDSCAGWAVAGECKRNPDFMTSECQLSCRTCTGAQKRLKQPLQQVLLNNGVMMPTVAFGTAGLGQGTLAAVAEAVRAGYRHFDSAQAYEWYNEAAVGQALNESGIPRSALFITTKVHPKNFGRDELAAAMQVSLRELRSSYVDLLLLHYPRCWDGLAGCTAKSTGMWQQAWRELEQLHASGVARAIGVSNFAQAELKDLIAFATIKPQVVQVHVDPLAQATDILDLCTANGIQVEAYSSLGTQHPPSKSVYRNGAMVGGGNAVLTNPLVERLAEKLKRSPAQVVLRWALQRGLVVLPRSSNPGRQRENLDLFSFEIPEEDMEAMERASTASY